MVGSAQSAARLVVGEHCLEARSVAVEEQLLAGVVEVPSSLGRVTEQRACIQMCRVQCCSSSQQFCEYCKNMLTYLFLH